MTLRARCASVGNPVAGLMLERVDAESLTGELDRAVEDELSWPELVHEVEGMMTEIRDLVTAHGSPSDRDDLPLYERDIEAAVESRDADLLRRRTERLREHAMRVMDRAGVLQPLVFENLSRRRDQMRHPARADRLIRDGEQARDTGEQERLRSINMELRSLLSEAPPPLDLSSTVLDS